MPQKHLVSRCYANIILFHMCHNMKVLGSAGLPGVEAGRMDGERDRFGKQDAEKWKGCLCHSVIVRVKMKWSL